MRTVFDKAWHGVRMRDALGRAGPDSPCRSVRLPALWEDVAADALAALTPLPDLRCALDAVLQPLPAELAATMRQALLVRQASPGAGFWRGRPDQWVLNLAAFDDPGLGFDAAALRRATADIAASLSMLAPARQVLRLTDLDGLLAALGLAYDSPDARDFAQSVCDMLTTAAPNLTLVTAAPDAVDALVGAEAGGVAPRFSWLDAAGGLSRGARAFLAARGLSAETALASALRGDVPLPVATRAAHAAMREALAGRVALAEPTPPPAVAAAPRRTLPARPGGCARRAAIAGHKVFIRTAEFEDGALAEVSLALPKESAAVRGMADILGQLASLALQHGTPLPEILELLAGTRFSPSGAVEGDPDVQHTSSPLDYLARALASAYAVEVTLPPPALEEEAPPPPLLPLEMPAAGRPALRLVR